MLPGIDLAGVTAWFEANVAGARTISEAMKVAAARAIAARVADDELRPDYIVPSVFDKGVAQGVAAAVRQAAEAAEAP